MKFKFCGDGDCPLWALAALHALGSLPAQLFRTLLQAACQQDDDQVMELLKDTSLASREESARALAAIRWVLRSAWSCACPGPALARDLAVLGVLRAHAAALADAAEEHRQAYVDGLDSNGFAASGPGPALARDLAVLGVPRAHASALADAAEEHRQAYVDGLDSSHGFAVNKLTDISVSPAPIEGALKLTLHSETAAGRNRTELLIEKTQAQEMLEQLKVAYKKMEALDGDQ